MFMFLGKNKYVTCYVLKEFCLRKFGEITL